MKTLASFPTDEEAHLLKAYLESCGVPAFVRDELTAATYSMAIGGVRVAVNDEDFERASELVAAPPGSGDLQAEKPG